MEQNRECDLCRTKRDLESLASILNNRNEPWKSRMKKLRAAANDCPECILAAIQYSDAQTERLRKTFARPA